DLSYDFITRPGYHHALAMGDIEFLRLTLKEGIRYGVDQASLVHALQNHDELTYELVHFTTSHAADEFNFRDRRVTGAALPAVIRPDLRSRIQRDAVPLTAPIMQN